VTQLWKKPAIGICHAVFGVSNIRVLRNEMKNNAQKLAVEAWDAGPELRVLEHDGAKPGKNASNSKLPPTPFAAPRNRPEQAVLGWEIRMGRLTHFGHDKSRSS
jgi:hypothetical protein